MLESESRCGMPLPEALSVLHDVRGDSVVIPSMGSAREWIRLFDPHPLDFVHVPSSMGQTPALGLGIALAQPSRRVVVCCGDGSLLMNLGCLVTIAAARPKNLILLVFDNRAYEVTGGQPTPAADTPDGVDFAQIARAAGFRQVLRFQTLEDWRSGAEDVMSREGPVCVVLDVENNRSAGPVGPLPPASVRAREFSAAIQHRGPR